MNISSTPSLFFKRGKVLRNASESILEEGRPEVADLMGSAHFCSNSNDDDDNSSVESALFDAVVAISDDMASEDVASVCPLPLVSVELPLDPTSLSTTALTSATETRPLSAYTVAAFNGGAAVASKISSAPLANMVSAYPHPSPTLNSSEAKRRTCDQHQNTGRWSTYEHELFLRGLEVYGSSAWTQISKLVCTRTAIQVRTHAKKYFIKMAKEGKAMQRDRVDDVCSRSNSHRVSLVIPGNDVKGNVKIGKTAVTDAEAFRFRIPDRQDHPSRSHPYCGQVGSDSMATRPSQVRKVSVVSLDTHVHTRELAAYSPNLFDIICEPNGLELKPDCQNMGNKRLLAMLDSRIQDYKKANLAEKHDIARDVVASMMDDESSQFLQQDKVSGVYKPLPKELATFRVMSLLNRISQVADGGDVAS